MAFASNALRAARDPRNGVSDTIWHPFRVSCRAPKWSDWVRIDAESRALVRVRRARPSAWAAPCRLHPAEAGSVERAGSVASGRPRAARLKWFTKRIGTTGRSHTLRHVLAGATRTTLSLTALARIA